MFKKIFWFTFLVLLLSGAFGLVSADYGKLISMEASSFNPEAIYPGDIVTLNIDLKNRAAGVEVLDLTAKLSPPEIMEGIILEQHVEGIGASAIQTIVFKFKVKEGTLPGTYSLPVSLAFKKKGFIGQFTEDYDVFIEVQGIRSIDIKNIQLDKVSPHIGDNLKVSAVIENNGSLEAREVIVSLTRIDQDSFGNIVPLTETSVHLGNIGVGQSKNVDFDLFLSKQLDPDTYNFQISVSLLDATSTETEKVSFEAKGRPDLILGGVDFSIEGRPKDKRMLQGDAFSLSIQLENIGNETAKAVEVYLETDEGITGIKENFVGNIDEEDSGAAIFDLSVGFTVGTGEHLTKVTIKYIDELDQEQSITKDVMLYVNARPPESPIGYLFLLVILGVVGWFVLKQVNRFISLRKR